MFLIVSYIYVLYTVRNFGHILIVSYMYVLIVSYIYVRHN